MNGFSNSVPEDQSSSFTLFQFCLGSRLMMSRVRIQFQIAMHFCRCVARLQTDKPDNLSDGVPETGMHFTVYIYNDITKQLYRHALARGTR